MKRMMLASAVLAISMVGAAMAETTPRQISVTGEGQVETVPDMATITLGVTNEAADARAAMDATSVAVTRVLGRLSELGIAERDVQTQQFSLNPVWSNRGSNQEQRAKITGFVASNMVLVRVRDMSVLGVILDSVIADGANDFNGLQLSVQEPRPFLDQARRDAVADAIAKATLLADAAGVTLGPVVSMVEHGGGRPVQMMEMASARGGSAPIAGGEVSISASVSMVFSIAE